MAGILCMGFPPGLPIFGTNKVPEASISSCSSSRIEGACNRIPSGPFGKVVIDIDLPTFCWFKLLLAYILVPFFMHLCCFNSRSYHSHSAENIVFCLFSSCFPMVSTEKHPESETGLLLLSDAEAFERFWRFGRKTSGCQAWKSGKKTGVSRDFPGFSQDFLRTSGFLERFLFLVYVCDIKPSKDSIQPWGC